jgi:MFS family permease
VEWLREVGREQWRVLAAAHLGYALDAMDVLLFSFALTGIRGEFQLSSAAAGALAATPMVTSALGGFLFGYLSDRCGRVRALTWSIFCFSLLTGLTASSQTVVQLVFWRSLAGIGLGGEWAAGSVLVAETWPARHRAKGVAMMQSGWAVGYLTAAVLAGLVLPRWGWRPLFLLGILPALFTWAIRRGIAEPAVWRKQASRDRKPGAMASLAALLQPPLARPMILLTALCSCLLFGYWGLFTWIPAYLSSPLARGGAGLSLVKSSAWIVPMQIGAFFGYILFGFFADRVGRRCAFFTFVLSTAALIPVYGWYARSPLVLLATGPLLGFFGHGYFSSIGVMAAELFPPWIRSTAQGFSYNVGRAMSALAPATVGALADRYGVGAALGLASVFFVTAAFLMRLLPETRPPTAP